MSKCFFLRDSVILVGHDVSADGIQVDPRRSGIGRH